MVRVKICGITNWADARLSVDLGATMLGFIFHPASPRVVSPARAWDIIRRLPSCVVPVGLFVDWQPGVVDALARAIHLKAVQLQGDESPADARAVHAHGHKVMKAFRVKPGFRVASLARYRGAWAYLLDGFAPGLYGGTGKTVDLKIARRAKRYGRIILAGGLRAENVREAIQVAEPFGVDVCSGTEARPGKKDPARLRAFFREVEASDGLVAS
ncbi:MAG: phosphoribosylanthranilate isomerase [Candidatus Acidiferrales bacterium]